jgi:hypothetical protein
MLSLFFSIYDHGRHLAAKVHSLSLDTRSVSISVTIKAMNLKQSASPNPARRLLDLQGHFAVLTLHPSFHISIYDKTGRKRLINFS